MFFIWFFHLLPFDEHRCQILTETFVWQVVALSGDLNKAMSALKAKNKDTLAAQV